MIYLSLLALIIFGNGHCQSTRPKLEQDNVLYTEEIDFAFDYCISHKGLAPERKFEWFFNYSFPLNNEQSNNEVSGLSCVLNKLELIKDGLINVEKVALLLRDHNFRYNEQSWIKYFRYTITMADYCHFKVLSDKANLAYNKKWTNEENASVHFVQCVRKKMEEGTFEYIRA
ncbi:uncharacterized protein LOC106668590 [Cimex lectularius]|uniref:Odorant binding protein n=1 Tax=Cimex lectularius TaxID=79782 RepID=A0A8I6RZA3_CIMLE|nr:uncharacterized protein LOC106668590 [Cimex lectularius]